MPNYVRPSIFLVYYNLLTFYISFFSGMEETSIITSTKLTKILNSMKYIFVRGSEGAWHLKCFSDTLVGDIKTEIRSQTKITQEMQMIFFGGKLLSDDQAVCGVGTSNDSDLLLITYLLHASILLFFSTSLF
jgi:hypothetical protein